MGVEEFRFLQPWSQLLPPKGWIAAAGHGGVTTVLQRVLAVYRERGTRVLWSQTTEHAVPFELREHCCEPDADVVRERLGRDGIACCTGPSTAADRRAGLPEDRIEELARAAGADVVLVEAGVSTGGRLDPKVCAVDWPMRTRLALCVGHLGLVGRLWSEETVVGAGPLVAVEGDDPRRVRTADLVAALEVLVDGVPEGARPLPFLSGLAAYRDIDGMFAVVESMLARDPVWVVVLAELLGDERRDSADLRGVEAALGGHFSDSERVYAVYPASLDADASA